MGNNAFTVLPMSQRFSLEPGKTYSGKVTVVNPADATENFKYKVGVSPYGVMGEDYTADLTTDYTRSAISKWIKIAEPTGELKPNETRDVEFTITVPNDAPAGGQYAAITITSDNEQAATSGVAVQNVFEMASIVYARVAGETKHEGEILENNVPGFSTTVPVTLSALISNNGNVHEDATFVISVSDAFTGRVILPTEEDDGQYSEIIMPETTRKIERNVSNLPAVGVVRVKQVIYYNGDVSEVSKDIWICPIWFMALVAATIISIVVAIVMIVKKHRKGGKKAKKSKKAEEAKE